MKERFGENQPFRAELWGGEGDDLKLYRFVHAPNHVQACFTTRWGGFSDAPYDTLNLGYHVKDDPVAVDQNRDILCSILGVDRTRITVPRQRHSTVISLIDDESKAGAGSNGESSWLDPCDGLITRMKNVPLMLLFADCVPLVLAAAGPEPAIAVVHAGRQGLMDGIVTSVVDAITDLGYEASSILAAIGPAIGQCCYEVDDTMARDFADRFGEELVADNHLDLTRGVKKDLTAAGLVEDNIAVLGDCTSCNTGFFSYRRDGETGRHAAIAWIE